MKSPELESSATFGAGGAGLGVAGINFASASASSSSTSTSTSSPSSPSITRTPRWGSIRQRFSSIQSRDNPSVPVDSVDDGMWDKNDAAFLEEVARDSPLLLGSPDRFDSLAPVFEDTYTGQASTSSSRAPSFIRIRDAEALTHRSPHSASSHLQSLQRRPSSASSSTPSSAASAASVMSTSVVTQDEMSASSQAFSTIKPWPRSMRRMASANMLPDLPEQNRTDDFITFSRSSTASSSPAVPMSPPLLPPIGSSASFMSGAFARASHLIQSPHGNDKGSAHSSLRPSPSLTDSVHATSDATRSATAEQYPRSPSLHSSSSFTTTGFVYRSQDDRFADSNARARTLSSGSASSSTPQHTLGAIDRRTSRSVIGSPFAMRTSFSSSRPSSPDAFLQDTAVVSSSPTLSRVAAEHGASAFATDSERRPSIASVMESPYPGPGSQPIPQSADELGSQASATARGKRMASASMRGVPGSPTKKSSAAVAPASAHATSSTATATATNGAPNGVARKHTKNKSSLVSGLRKLMGKREREGKAVAALTSDSAVAADDVFMRPTSPSPAEQSAQGHSAATFAWPSQSSTDEKHLLQTQATSIDTSQHGGLNLLGLTPDALGSGAAVETMLDRNQSLKSQAGRKISHAAWASPSMARRSPSVDLLRSFGTMGRVPQAGLSGPVEGVPAEPASPRSRTKSIDGLTKPLREVLGQRSRKDSRQKTASRASVIEHISHNDARRMTGCTGPVILETKEALEKHRAQYAMFPSEIDLPERSNFDMLHQLSASSHPSDRADNAAAGNIVTETASLTDHGSIQSPARPQRPEQSSSHGSAPTELLTPSNSGEMVSGTGGSTSSNIGGISSCGSSFVSASSAVTDRSMTLRQPFSFQSQAYRPHSRESRGSRKPQPSPPSSPSSLAFHLPGELAALGLHDTSMTNGNRLMHRPAPSLGSLAPVPSGQALGSYAINPPHPQAAKQGHSSRGSLNSLVSGSKPWSSFLGSPVLGSSCSLSHHKRVSIASISRPMSVSSSALSSDINDLSTDVAHLTLRPSDFAGRVRSRIRVDSAHSNFSEPTNFLAWQPVSSSALNSNNSSSVHVHSQQRFAPASSSQSHLSPPSAPYLVTLPPPAAAAAAPPPTTAVALSSSSSQHSHQSHQSHQAYDQSGTSTASASSGTFAPAIANAQYRVVPASSSTGLRQQAPSPSPLGRPATIDDDLNQQVSGLQPSSSTPTTSPPAATAFFPTTAPGFSSRPRPTGAGHRSSLSGSSLSHRKRSSFGLAIEPSAHSAFDSIPSPSPLLRTRRISLAFPEGAAPQRPFSISSASIGRTTSDSSANTSPNGSARVSAATLSSNHVLESEDKVEIETLPDGSPTKGPLSAAPALLKGSVPVLESAMAAATLEPTISHRHSVSVPMDEGDSPRQYQEESWNRATGGTVLAYGIVEDSQAASAPATRPRQYMIHSPNEEEGPALAMSDTTSSSGRMSQATKDIAFGSIAGMVSKVFEHPFDLVKVRLQTQSADRPPRYAGAFDCFKQTYLQEGIRGLYRGLSMPVVGATLENACLFFTYNQIQSAIRWANGEAKSGASAAQADAGSPLSIPQLAIAAAGAGAVTSLVLTPIELIKCKMQVQMITREQHAPISTNTAAANAGGLQQQRRIYTSAIRRAASPASSAEAFKSLDGPLTLLRRTIAAEGIRGLWLGQTGTLLRETGGGVAWFLAFESCSRYLIARKKAQWNRSDVTKKDLTSLELVGAGALAGVSYNVVLFPADCVKSTMQTEQEMRPVSSTAKAGEKWKGTGFYDTFKKIYKTRGIKGLYAGCGVTCLRSAPSSAIIFLMYNKLEKLSDEYGF
ncbi:related to mitochondrial amino acid transporter ARG-13 [Ustilago sp. UG-2017a]|nr:related to mitochondrial amino acid transporter ARG-13 [Ustilago sp. UG-2017a]